MAIFRVVEKLGLNRRLGSGWEQYLITVVLVIAGASVFAVIMQKLIVAVAKKNCQAGQKLYEKLYVR